MKNLILGSEGFVGKYFCNYLEKKGETVIRCDLKITSENDLRFIKINFSDIDRIYFLAWEVGGAKYLYRKDTQLFQLQWNLKLMENTFPQIIESKIPFLFISSQLADERDYVYGVSKRLGELWSTLGGGKFIRLWNVYGPIEMLSEKTHVVSDFVLQAVRDKQIKLLTSGEEKRQFIHIEDVCDAFLLAMSEGLDGIIDITSSKWVSILELSNIIAKYTNAIVLPGKSKGSTPVTPIHGKLRNWQPRISLEWGIKNMIDQLKL